MLALPVGTAKSVRVDLIRVSMASEPIMSTGSGVPPPGQIPLSTGN